MNKTSTGPNDSNRSRRMLPWSIGMASLGLIPILIVGFWLDARAHASPQPAVTLLVAAGAVGHGGDSDSDDSDDSGDSGDSGSAGCNTGGGASVTPGVAVCEYLELTDTARLSAVGGTLIVATNATSSERVKVSGSATIDGDVYVGVGGNVNTVVKLEGSGSITGSTAVLDGNVEIPAIPTPGGMGVSVGDVVYSSGTTTISSDIHCDEFKIKNAAIVQISGNVTILADDDFEIEDSGQLKIKAGGSLTVCAKEDFDVQGTAQFNVNSADPSLATVLLQGGADVEVKNSARVYATIVGAGTKVVIKDSAELYGTVKCKKLLIKEQAKMIVDTIAAKKLVFKCWDTKSGSGRKGATRTKVNTAGYVKPTKDVNRVKTLPQDDGN